MKYGDENSEKSAKFIDIPSVVIEYIFSYLPVFDLKNCSYVCKKFNKTAMKDSMWKNYSINIAERSSIARKENQSNLEYIKVVFKDRCHLSVDFTNVRDYEYKFETIKGDFKQIEETLVSKYSKLDTKKSSTKKYYPPGYIKIMMIGLNHYQTVNNNFKIPINRNKITKNKN